MPNKSQNKEFPMVTEIKKIDLLYVIPFACPF